MTNNPTEELREQIRKCFIDTYMQTEGDTELFDTEETIDQLAKLIISQRIDEAHIGLANNEGSQARQLERINTLKATLDKEGKAE